MSGMNDNIFVYGTLLSGVGHAMHAILSQDAELVGAGFYNGRLYRVATYPGAVPSTDPDDRVFGEVYRLRNVAEVLSRLDEYEGCDPAAVAPTQYVRKTEAITLANATVIQAWIYIYNRPIHGLERIHSGLFLRPCA